MPLLDSNISYGVLLLIIGLRLIILSLPLNYDYPDEYWQGPEIAYKIYQKLINGKNKGYETWEWTMEDPIRNPVYQFLLSLGYVGAHSVIEVIKCVQENYGIFMSYGQEEFDKMMEMGPKIVQSIFAIIGDIYLIKLFYFYFGKQKTNTFSIFFIISNWFYLSMLSRTYINSFECILTSVAFYHWQIHHYRNLTKMKENEKIDVEIYSKDDLISRLIVLVSYVARPTSLIPWMIFWPAELILTVYEGYLIYKRKEKINNTLKSRQSKSIHNIISILLIIIMLAKNLIQMFEFLLCIALSCPFAHSLLVRYTFTKLSSHNGTFFMYLSLEILGHKEHRFLLPFMPFLLVITISGYMKVKEFLWNRFQRSFIKKFCFILLMLAISCFNIWMIYSVALHPKGGFDLLRQIRKDIDSRVGLQEVEFNENSKIGVMYLCEPHALPGHSMILRDVALMLPDESPLAKLSNRSATLLLTENPEELYELLVQEFCAKNHNSTNIDVRYVILQHKFCKHHWVNNFEKTKKHERPQEWIEIEDKCKFIETNYELVEVNNNRNIWETQIFGTDFLYLYKRKNKE